MMQSDFLSLFLTLQAVVK